MDGILMTARSKLVMICLCRMLFGALVLVPVGHFLEAPDNGSLSN
jgi:hypothetical protein